MVGSGSNSSSGRAVGACAVKWWLDLWERNADSFNTDEQMHRRSTSSSGEVAGVAAVGGGVGGAVAAAPAPTQLQIWGSSNGKANALAGAA